jgi:hypothetical protein
MDNASQNKKESILKSLAIAGFISIVMLIAWLSIQLVSFVPEAFSSLASLAESINKHEQATKGDNENNNNLSIINATSQAESGKTNTISWETIDALGTYTFSYKCTDGVSIDINKESGIQSVTCDTNYDIGNTNFLLFIINSEKERSREVIYTIAFLGTNDTKPRTEATSSITITNNNIKDVSTTEEKVGANENKNISFEDESIVKKVNNETTETQTISTTNQIFTYVIPTSDPNGRTDLSTKFLGTGTIVGDTFFTGVIKQNESGAIQFEVINLGTKTSDDWTFKVKLPNKTTYTSAKQKPLKPNERALLTIGFSTTDDSSHVFSVTIDDATDNNAINDTFTKVVTFIK